MKKYLIVIYIAILCLVSFAVVSFAHSGGTDFRGGHYDQSTGSYHFHHGYPAHSHSGGCPYDYKDKTSGENGSSSSNKTYNYEIEEDEMTAGDIIGKIFAIIGLSILVLLVGFSTALLQGLHWLLMYPIKMLVNKFCNEDSREKLLDKLDGVFYIIIAAIVITIVSIIFLNV